MKVESLEIEVELIWTSKYAADLILKTNEQYIWLVRNT